MIRSVFTFGSGHTCFCGRSLTGCYVVIQAEHPRAEMIRAWGVGWAFEYDDEQQAGVGKYGLQLVQPSDTDDPNVCALCGSHAG